MQSYFITDKMLKSSKLSHKPHKPKDSSIRKTHLTKKPLRSRSPVRLSGASRSTTMKRISPGLKRGHSLGKRRASHSPRLRSIASSPHRSLSHRKPESPVSIDRVRMKGLKYEKRKHMSNSPVRHLGPSTSRRPMMQHDSHSVIPYPDERYQSTSSAIHSPQYVSPTRKKVRREPDRYFTSRSMSTSPPRRHTSTPLNPESHPPRRGEVSPVIHHRHSRNVPPGHSEREKLSYEARNKHNSSSSSVAASSHPRESIKGPFPSENSGHYRSASPIGRYSSAAQKTYAPTLHERFSSVIESHRSEPRVRYSREDLEKITIDIKRNVRDPSPTLRHIMNPSEVKLVRRANEGHRPIFDREEIKQAPRDLREDAYYERKASSSSYNSMHTIDLREVENYQITRHRFDSNHDLFSSGSGRTLNDRWQNPESRKSAMTLDRDEREKEYERIPVTRSYSDVRSRSRSGDRDFRAERYLDTKTSHRSDYQNRPMPISSSESRGSMSYPQRKLSVPIDARHKLNVRKSDRESHTSSLRSDSKARFHPHSDRHYTESVPSSRVERREHHSPIPESHKWSFKSRSPSREKSDFSRRPDKYSYKSWIEDKPDVASKSANYFEHESRDGSNSFSTRGSSRPFRSSRGFRSRGFRGLSRGSSYFRGSFRGYRGSGSPRGRGVLRR